jgi:hypothetical protein
MLSWYKVTLSTDDVIAMKHMTMMNEFRDLFMVNHHPKDAAMFSNTYIADGNHFYFSPGATLFSMNLISRWGGATCSTPDPLGLSLLVGNSDALKVLFPIKGSN